MDIFFIKFGFITIIILIIYLIKKVFDYYYFKKINHIWDDELNPNYIYKAARAYSQGAPICDVKGILINSINFDEEDIDKILSLSYQHNSTDGGYNSFIKAVNKVLGEDVYVTKK